jgi:mono/diheme cytochrome c family protein
MRQLFVSLLALIGAFFQTAVAQDAPPALTARVIAVGITGAGAVAPVGTFHPGGPIRDKPDFFAFTQSGRILDPTRVLVASSSNFGAPLAVAGAPEGSILSIDPNGEPLIVPQGFAKRGDQASIFDGRVQLFTAQSPAFLNSVTTPGAVSAAQPSVSNPLGISINNAFGRLWFASAPQGEGGVGLDSIIDPGGMPLAGAPSKLAGGVFVGDVTNRPQQLVAGGLRAGAVANAFIGMSPDGSKRAVFAVLTADGAVAQAHAEFNVDGLAPAGTVRPIALSSVTRTGMIFNWVPDRVLYVTEPAHNAITALTINTDDKVFRLQSKRTFSAPELSGPIDLTPAVPEVANPGFASNTTLAGGSDIYVANRGNGTVVRLRQDGTVVAVRRVTVNGEAIGGGRLNGIAVSPDAQKIYLTLSGALAETPNATGVLIEVPAFGPTKSGALAPPRPFGENNDAKSHDLAARGAKLFATVFTPPQGLGPLFNRSACLQCHVSPSSGGMGFDGLALVQRVGRFEAGRFDPLIGAGGPLAREHSIAEFGVACDLSPGPPPRANLISVRNAPPLYGLGLIDTIPDEALRAAAAAGRTRGKLHIVRTAQGERVGRYGWKADTATLEQFVAEAFRNELGITNPLAPDDLLAHSAGCGSAVAAPKDDGSAVRAVTAYVASLPPPASKVGPQHRAGETLFATLGCAACHTPALAGGAIALYSDLMLHDLGAAMDDRVVQGEASGKEWRTSPLWGLGSRERLLHDGRATTIADAILAHDGEAAPVTQAFRALPAADRAELLAFLQAL